uniref:Uncharacterized protein n=1 Tax=Lotus japonicus TaxID=34305 RepID=I3SN50_LOTJA|nr:unknown [Lotus japonicus]
MMLWHLAVSYKVYFKNFDKGELHSILSFHWLPLIPSHIKMSFFINKRVVYSIITVLFSAIFYSVTILFCILSKPSCS